MIPREYIMHKNILIFSAVLVLITVVVLSGCTGPTQYIRVDKYDEEPDNYINMSENQIGAFPHLKEAILNNESVVTPQEEFYKLSNYLRAEETKFIKYQNEYYEINLILAD